MDILLDSKNIALFIIALLNFVLAVLIYFNGKSYKVNKVYAWNIFTIILWIGAMFFYRSASLYYSLFWCMALYAAPTFIASSFLYFTYIFPSEEDKNIKVKKWIIILLNFLIVLFVFIPGLIIREVNIIPGQEKEIIFSLGYFIYVCYILFFFLFAFFRLSLKYYKLLHRKDYNSKVKKIQIESLFFGYTIAANLAFATNLIMPWLGYFFLNWLGQVFTIFMVGFTTYAIFRHHLFQVKLIISQFLVVVFSILLLFNVFLSSDIFEYIWKGILFIIFVYFGRIMIKNVVKEIEAEKQLESYSRRLKTANNQLKKLDKQKTEFMSFAAHQLRSPLTSVKGFASLIREGAFGKTSKKIKGAAEKIGEASEAMSDSVDDYLNISRIEQGRMEYNLEELDLYDLARGVVEEQQPTANKKKIKLTIVSDKYKKYPAKVDHSKVRQVINNFVDNAVKYTPKGKVEVRVSRRRGRVLIAIKDSGIGMSKETIGKLFQRYSRAEDTQGISGTGLGLYIARKMIEAQDGQAWAESKGENRGSTFYIQLPLFKNKK